MKKLKIESLFRLSLIVIINIFFNNIYIFIISVLFIYNKNFTNIIIFIIIFIIIYFNNNTNIDYINIGFVDCSNKQYAIVNKILYKVKVYDDNLCPGDIVILNASNNRTFDINDNKNNIKFIYKNKTKIIFKNIFKSEIYKKIDKSVYRDTYLSVFYSLNDYENEFENLSFNLCFYYLLLIIYKQNKKLSIILLSLYSIFFGFQIKFFLLIINLILSNFDLDNIESLSFKLLFICFINKYLFYNYSILISILFSSLSIFKDLKLDSVIIGVIQSIIFGEVKIFSSIFYKAYVYEKIFIFFLSILSLILPINYFYFKTLTLLNSLMDIISFSLRGKCNVFVLCVLYLIFRKLNNPIIKYLIFMFVMILPFNLLRYEVDFIDVGQGDSILIIDPRSLETVLIDTGSTYNYLKLKTELYKKGIYIIDYLIITHNDSDHNGNIENLYKDFKIRNIVTEGKDVYTKSYYFKNLNLDVSDNDNDNSLVYILNIDSYNILFTGDISSKIENNIIFKNNINDIDILKVSHHGSKTASSLYFIGSIKPEFAVIQTNGMYNHPSDEVIDNLNKFNVKTFITKYSGNVEFIFGRFIDYIKTSNHQFVIINK